MRKFYECDICDCIHPWDWNGDCRDDSARLSLDDVRPCDEHPNRGCKPDVLHNPNCDGGHCRAETGEVRVYPLGGHANLILCASCWAHENRYRAERTREGKSPDGAWPQVDWNTATIYGE